jgi:hypothetical protein
MNARTVPRGQAKAAAPSPRFDAKFIEDHKLIERYLENKLPLKGAVDLENYCRAHPGYLDNLKLSERAHASLKLLEASGRPVDLREPEQPWWRSPYILIGLAAATFVSLAAAWLLAGKISLLRNQLEDVKLRARQGPLVQPAVQSVQRIAPDRAPGMNLARIVVSTTAPQLIELHLDMTYTLKLNVFRITVDKQEQGRAMVLNNVMKDSNNDLRMTFNTTGLSAGIYTVRIEALPPRGDPIPDGWLILEVR